MRHSLLRHKGSAALPIPSDLNRFAVGCEQIASPAVDVAVHADGTSGAVKYLAAAKLRVPETTIGARFTRSRLAGVADDMATRVP